MPLTLTFLLCYTRWLCALCCYAFPKVCTLIYACCVPLTLFLVVVAAAVSDGMATLWDGSSAVGVGLIGQVPLQHGSECWFWFVAVLSGSCLSLPFPDLAGLLPLSLGCQEVLLIVRRTVCALLNLYPHPFNGWWWS